MVEETVASPQQPTGKQGQEVDWMMFTEALETENPTKSPRLVVASDADAEGR